MPFAFAEFDHARGVVTTLDEHLRSGIDRVVDAPISRYVLLRPWKWIPAASTSAERPYSTLDIIDNCC